MGGSAGALSEGLAEIYTAIVEMREFLGGRGCLSLAHRV